MAWISVVASTEVVISTFIVAEGVIDVNKELYN